MKKNCTNSHKILFLSLLVQFFSPPPSLEDRMGLVHITSWYPNFNGSHFGLPPSEIHRMTGLPPKIVWTIITCSHRPHTIGIGTVSLPSTCFFFNTTSDHLQIAKHRSIPRNEPLTDVCAFAICRFSQVALITSRNLTHGDWTSFSISNRFWCYFWFICSMGTSERTA